MSRARDFADLAGSADAGGITGKNMVVNGSMAVNQRGNLTVSNGAIIYTLDRFQVYSAGSSVAVAQDSGSGEFHKSLKITGATSNSSVLIQQRIEASTVAHAVGKKVTASFMLWGSTTGTATINFQTANASDNWSSSSAVGSDINVAFTTTPTVYTATTTVVLPSAASNGLQLRISLGAVGNAVTRNLTGIQLEVGSTATDFDHSESYGETLAKCQRYFQTAHAGWSGNTNNDSFYRAVYQLPVTMRAAPTATWTDANVASFDGSYVNETQRVDSGAVYRQASATSNGQLFTATGTFDSEL